MFSFPCNNEKPKRIVSSDISRFSARRAGLICLGQDITMLKDVELKSKIGDTHLGVQNQGRSLVLSLFGFTGIEGSEVRMDHQLEAQSKDHGT